MMTFKFAELPHTVPMVWEGCMVEAHELDEVTDALRKVLDLERTPHVMGCVETLPDPGDTIETSGGRIDLFFAIADEDVPRVSLLRLKIPGMRWVMDADPDLYAGPARRLVMDAVGA